MKTLCSRGTFVRRTFVRLFSIFLLVFSLVSFQSGFASALVTDAVEGGLEAALPRKKPARPSSQKGEGDQEAQLSAIACSAPPEGRVRWTLRLLAERRVELRYFESISAETIRQVLKKTSLSLG